MRKDAVPDENDDGDGRAKNDDDDDEIYESSGREEQDNDDGTEDDAASRRHVARRPAEDECGNADTGATKDGDADIMAVAVGDVCALTKTKTRMQCNAMRQIRKPGSRI